MSATGSSPLTMYCWSVSRKVCDWNSENDGMSLSVAAIAGEARVVARTAADARANCPRRLRCMEDLLRGVVDEGTLRPGVPQVHLFPENSAWE